MAKLTGLVCLLVCASLCSSLTVKIKKHCNKLDSDLSDNFSENIAHAVHSMTVQGLQLFNPRATVKNSVPTVNLNVSAPEKVVPFAPDEPTGSDFSTPTMNVIDMILSHVGKSDDGLGEFWSPVERVVHTFHMWDLWNKVLEEFNANVKMNPPKDNVCKCLMNTEKNGIRDSVQWVAEHYKSGTPITLLNRPIPKLNDADTWQVWKDRLLHYYDTESLHDAAKYIYCATKDF
ncbi:uncharacterized protein [Antedon mediterranea]|uniref:uncharacterized protein n=1 Tax=Antedon mediterranea TaxID=105859 RepID=UPI003AF9AEFD